MTVTVANIEFGGDGLPIIAYYHLSTNDLRVAHCQNAARTCTEVTVVASAGAVGEAASRAREELEAVRSSRA